MYISAAVLHGSCDPISVYIFSPYIMVFKALTRPKADAGDRKSVV